MNAYFFKMNREEKDNILDQHKKLYDGYVTRYNQESNQTPLYTQDLANDKNGITLNNAGTVKHYTNININEAMLDMIGDGPSDLKNGTVDFDSDPEMLDINTQLMHDKYPSPNEDEEDEYVSLGKSMADDDDDLDIVIDIDYPEDHYEYDIDQLDDFSADELYEESPEENTEGVMAHLTDNLSQMDEEKIPEFVNQLHESLDMFRRFKKYN